VKITNILRGIGGEFEWTRVFGAAGVAIYIIAANGFEAWTIFYQGKPFDVTAYCLAFPTGLGAAIAAIATAAGQTGQGRRFGSDVFRTPAHCRPSHNAAALRHPRIYARRRDDDVPRRLSLWRFAPQHARISRSCPSSRLWRRYPALLSQEHEHAHHLIGEEFGSHSPVHVGAGAWGAIRRG
jgi:hypothetical protein